jgi:hypothetical protein
MSNPDDILFKEKYLKYKSKYMNLKKLESQLGGFTFDDGIMCFFTSNKLADKIKDMFTVKAPKLDQIKEVLHDQAYMIKDGEKEFELTLKPKSVFKKAEALPGIKPNKIPFAGKLFNRCDTANIKDVKTVLSAYKFTPEAMIVVRIYKKDTNKLMSVASI